MTTTRDLCGALGAALQVPGVEKHAARLVRDGHLPRAGEEVDEADAALLLLVVLGASQPEQASWTAERLVNLPRLRVSKQFGLCDWWLPVSDAEVFQFAPTLLELMSDILGCLVEGFPGVRAGVITVARDAADVTVFVHSGAGFYRVTYGAPSVAIAGLRVSASISGDEMKALADSLKPNSLDAPLHAVERTMPSLSIN